MEWRIMTDDLVKRLQSLHKQATVERSHFYVRSCAEDAIRRIEELETKLTKALEFIEDLTGCEWPYCEDAKRVLAELKGNTDE